MDDLLQLAKSIFISIFVIGAFQLIFIEFILIFYDIFIFLMTFYSYLVFLLLIYSIYSIFYHSFDFKLDELLII